MKKSLILLFLSMSVIQANTTYKVKKGDSLYKIAKSKKVSVAKLKKLNNIKGSHLKIGEKIVINKSKRKSTTTYRVKKGDSLYKIAKSKKVSVAKLKKLNNIKGSHLTVGEKIVIKGKRRTAKKSIRYSLNNTAKKQYKRQSKVISKTRITKEAKKHLGKKYVWAANGPRTFDCSGYTKYILSKQGKQIPRTSINQSKFGQKISRSNLRPGDLVFFDTSKKRKGYVNHVGIYLGNNKFIHASSAKKRVVITSLSKNFYSNRFKGGRRVN